MAAPCSSSSPSSSPGPPPPPRRPAAHCWRQRAPPPWQTLSCWRWCRLCTCSRRAAAGCQRPRTCRQTAGGKCGMQVTCASCKKSCITDVTNHMPELTGAGCGTRTPEASQCRWPGASWEAQKCWPVLLPTVLAQIQPTGNAQHTHLHCQARGVHEGPVEVPHCSLSIFGGAKTHKPKLPGFAIPASAHRGWGRWLGGCPPFPRP